MEFGRAEDDEGRYGWIEQVLRRFGYRQLAPAMARADKGAVLAYLQHLSGYSRAQVTQLVSRWPASGSSKRGRLPHCAGALLCRPMCCCRDGVALGLPGCGSGL